MKPGYSRFFPIFIFGTIALTIIFPFLSKGYILTLDMIFSGSFITDNFSPVFLLVKFLSFVLPGMILQKILLFSILFLSGLSMYCFVDIQNKPARYFAGIFYMLNPFVYFRFLAGQWALLLAYALFPFVVMSIKRFTDKNDMRSASLLALSFTLISFQVHFLIFSSLFLGAFITYMLISSRNKLIKNLRKFSRTLLVFFLMFFLINSYWIFSFADKEKGKIDIVSQKDYSVFGTSKGNDINKMTNSAMLYGFWRGGYITPQGVIPPSIIYGIAIIILFLTIYGILLSDSKYKIPIAVLGIMSLILAAGMSSQLMEKVYAFLFTKIPFIRAFREPNKFAAITAFTYSFFSAFAIPHVRDKEKIKKITAIILTFILLALPFVYTITMFNSFWNQLEPVDYPDDWYKTDQYLDADDDDFNVLFLPWHMYMTFSWNPKQRIANPARIFFSKPIIQGDNMEAGSIYSQSTDPQSGYIETLLSQGNITGSSLLKLDIKYIILAKESDYNNYQQVLNNKDLEVVFDKPSLYLLVNKEWKG